MKQYISIFILLFIAVINISAEDRETLRVQSEPDYPPFCIEDENGNATGFSIDLFRAAAEIMGYKVEFAVGPWYLIKNNLAEGVIDALPMVGRSPEREKEFDFTVPYHELHGAVFVRNGDEKIRSLEDLHYARIIVMKDDNADEYVSRTFEDAAITRTDTFEDAFTQLGSGKADAVIAQKLMGQELLNTLAIRNIRTLDIPLEGFALDFSFAVKKGNSNLLADLNEGLVLLISNGTYERLYKKWFFKKLPEMSYQEILRAVIPVLLPVILFVSIAAVVLLELRVRARTNSLRAEVVERKKAEAEITRQLEEKDILLKEVHHRIKNNFSSIEAFIALSSSKQSNTDARDALETASRRVSSMRMLYEKLLLDDKYSKMSLRSYAEPLINEIISLFSDDGKAIRIDIDIVDVEINADSLFYVGIILNELITNSMKYAFPGSRSGVIKIMIETSDGKLRIIVKDDGIGISEPGDSSHKGFGTTIIKMLCEQMHGKYTVKNDNGTENIIDLSLKGA